MEPWKTNLDLWKAITTNLELYRGVMGGNRWSQETPRRKLSFFVTDTQTLQHDIWYISSSSSQSTSPTSSSPTWHNGKVLRLFLLDHHFCRGLLLFWAGDRNVELVRGQGQEIIPYFKKWNTFLAGWQQSIPHQVTFGHHVGSHRQVLRIQREYFPASWRERKLGINLTSLQMKE